MLDHAMEDMIELTCMYIIHFGDNDLAKCEKEENKNSKGDIVYRSTAESIVSSKVSIASLFDNLDDDDYNDDDDNKLLKVASTKRKCSTSKAPRFKRKKTNQKRNSNRKEEDTSTEEDEDDNNFSQYIVDDDDDVEPEYQNDY